MYALSAHYNTPNNGMSRKKRRRIIAALRLVYALVMIAREVMS